MMTPNFTTAPVFLCQPLMLEQYSLEKEISYYFSKLLLFIQYLFLQGEPDSLLQASFSILFSDLYFLLSPTCIPNPFFYCKSISLKLFTGPNCSQHLCLGLHCKRFLLSKKTSFFHPKKNTVHSVATEVLKSVKPFNVIYFLIFHLFFSCKVHCLHLRT